MVANGRRKSRKRRKRKKEEQKTGEDKERGETEGVGGMEEKWRKGRRK